MSPLGQQRYFETRDRHFRTYPKSRHPLAPQYLTQRANERHEATPFPARGTHGLSRLTDGFLEGGDIECPLHSGRFNITTGKGLGEPIAPGLRIYADTPFRLRLIPLTTRRYLIMTFTFRPSALVDLTEQIDVV